MELNKFKELIEKFVEENFVVDSCRECHEQTHPIIPDSYKDFYDEAIKELYEEVKK